MIELDGTPNKARLGANAILGVSLACAKAAAAELGQPLYRYVGGVAARTLPVPMMNIVNGGVHADNPIDIQEFMIMPVGAPTLRRGVCAGRRDLPRAASKLHDAGHNTNVGDEGGFAPNLASADEALGFIMQAIEAAGYRPGEDVVLALDPASTEFFKNGTLRADGRGQDARCRRHGDISTTSSSRAIPIVSIEDGMAEDDWDGWAALTRDARQKGAARRRRSLRHQPGAAARRHREAASPTPS